MNKLIIVLLAVCLVNVHAFVKRDTAAASQSTVLEDLQKQLSELPKTINDQVSKALDPEKIKKDFGTFIDEFTKTINSYKPKPEEPKA